jgi:hypothetical protein
MACYSVEEEIIVFCALFGLLWRCGLPVLDKLSFSDILRLSLVINLLKYR